MRPIFASLSAVLAGAGAAAAVAASAHATAPSAPAAASDAGQLVSVTPQRLLDTRSTDPVGPHATEILQVADTHGVPDNTSAAVLNVTALRGTSGGYLTVFMTGDPVPKISNINFRAGQTVANLVLAQMRIDDGSVAIYNASGGTVDLLVDLTGYVVGGTPPARVQGAVQPVDTSRLLDTRSGTGGVHGPVAAHGAISFAVGGRAGVPATARAAVLNVTATGGTSSGFVTAFPTGSSVPTTSSLDYGRGQTVPNLVVVPIGTDNKVSLYNGSTGTVQLLADVQGYVTRGDPVTINRLGVLTAARALDTRAGKPVAPHSTVTLSLAGKGGVPLTGVASVVVNLTATAPTANGYLVAYSTVTRPPVSNVNFAAHQTVADLVVTTVDANEQVKIYNGSSGTVHVLADVAGWTRSANVRVPKAMVSHYLDNLTSDNDANAAVMDDEGCADGTAGDSFVLLDVGAQSYHGPHLSVAHPGVAIALTSPTVRLTYPELLDALESYLQGFARCAPETVLGIAVGTNNSGNFTDSSDPDNPVYPALTRGTDWANDVVDPLRDRAQTISSKLGVLGAIDIENGDPDTDGFDNSFTRALNWENTYRAAALDPTLIYNGSANGCPTAYNTGTTTTACNDGWTLGQFAELTDPVRNVSALPQIYFTSQSVQWANIDRIATHGLEFQGSLTQHGVDGSFTPPQGWAALYHAIGTVVADRPIYMSIDIRPATAAGARLVHARAVA